jgi:hypothetical protein
MALFTDGIMSTIQDLIAQDSSCLSVAQTENIDLSTKLSLAQQEVGMELTALLQRRCSYEWQYWLNPNPQLNNVVVTPPMQFWHVFLTLKLFYQDAYFNQLNDRYQGKRDQFQELAKRAMDQLIETGLGIVSDPMPQAATPQLSAISGGAAAATYYASMSWLNAEGEEGQTGVSTSLAVPDGNVLAVQPVNQPANAVSWNVFVGLSPETLILQNGSPLALDEVWVQVAPLLTTGAGPSGGQTPNRLHGLTRVIQRG